MVCFEKPVGVGRVEGGSLLVLVFHVVFRVLLFLDLIILRVRLVFLFSYCSGSRSFSIHSSFCLVYYLFWCDILRRHP